MANDAESPFSFISIVAATNYSVLQRITMNGTAGNSGCHKRHRTVPMGPGTGKFYLTIPEVNGPGNDTQPGAVMVFSPQQTERCRSIMSLAFPSAAARVRKE